MDKIRAYESTDKQMIPLSIAPKFEAKFNKMSTHLQEVFTELIIKCSKFCSKCFPTNTPDFRLQKSFNFCLINFVNSKVRIHIRTDGLKLESELLTIRPLPNHHYNGWEWVEVAIDKECEVDEAVMLIEKAFRHSD